MADRFQTQCPHCGVKFQISAQQLTLANGNVRCGSCLQVFQASSNLVPLTGGTPAGTGSARPAATARPAGAAPTARPSAAPASGAARGPASPAPSPTPPSPARAAAAPAARPAARPAAPTPPPRPAPPAPPPAAKDDLDDIFGGIDADDDLADMILKELEEPARPAAKPAAPPPRTPPPPPPQAAAASEGIDDLDDIFGGANADDDLADMILKELESPQAAAPVPSGEPQWAPSGQAEPQWAPSGQPVTSSRATPGPAGNKFGIQDNPTRVTLGKGQDDFLIGDDIGIDDDNARFGDSRTTNKAVTAEDEDLFGASANTYKENIEEPVDESWAKELIGEKVEDEKDALVRKFTEIKADNLTLATTGVQRQSALQERLARLDRNDAAGIDDLNPGDELDFLNNDGGLTMQDVEIGAIEQGSSFDTAGMAHEVAWGKELFWGALSAVFALLLLGQYMAINFNDLSRDESWRGIYEVTCGAVGCELPPRIDVTRIQGANLVVRSHPNASNALIIDAIVYNRAPFPQPFPDLELSFSDSAGRPIAGRVFKPSEYLRGEITGDESMPPDTPVHLTIEIVDPGKTAVNYEVRFLAPQAAG